jgi:hypothetical protein
MAENRLYTSRRQAIANALVDVIKQIDGSGTFLSKIYEVTPRLKFWDEVDNYPSVHVSAGAESREYQGGGYKDRYLSVTIRIYVDEENSVDALEALIEDIETVVENNSDLLYVDRQGKAQRAKQITLVSIDTDEGVLEPKGAGEMLFEVHY